MFSAYYKGIFVSVIFNYIILYGTLCLLSSIKGTACYYFRMIELKDIQRRLRDEIKQSSMSQKEIAEKLGINPSTISKYLRLDKFPSIETFANLCEILDVSSDDILGLTK